MLPKMLEEKDIEESKCCYYCKHRQSQFIDNHTCTKNDNVPIELHLYCRKFDKDPKMLFY